MQAQGSTVMRRLRRALLAAAATTLIGGAAMAQTARHDYDIPAQPAGEALNAYARQSGLRILFPYDAVAGKQSRPIAGEMTEQQALDRLLADAGLVVVSRENGVVTLGVARFPAGGAEETTQVDELVVTANKREERSHDVPASVTALRASSLVETGAVKFDDYVARVPGLVVDNTSAGGGLNQISIRGVTTGGGGNPTVGVYIDDSPFGSSTLLGRGTILSPDLDPSDLQRIEVLRGPQGTLYGAGSMGGLIKFVTTDPDPTAASGRLQADASHVDGGGAGYGLRGAANLPLNEAVAVRISAFDRRDPGYIDDPLLGVQDVNEAHVYGGRLALGWRVNDAWTVTLSALTQQLRQDGNSIMDFDLAGQPVFGDLEQGRAFGTGRTEASYAMYNLRIQGDLGWAELVSATSYSRVTSDVNTDATPIFGPIVTAFFGIPNAGAAIETDSELDKFSQELRLVSPDGGRFSWQVGAFYTHEDALVVQSVPVFDATTGQPTVPPLPHLIDAVIPSTFRELAVFGDVTYRFSPRFDVTAGLRYSHNDQSGSQTLGGLLLGPAVTLPMESDDSSVTWLVTPRFKISDEVMAYVRVASGYRPGGPNTAVPGVSPSFQPDEVVNYEAGLKADLFDRRLSLELAAFYIDWTDIQLNLISPLGISYLDNAGAASIHGVEGAMAWRPIDGLQVNANFAYTDAVLGEDLPGPAIGFEGDALPSIPHWAAQVSADYEFPLSGPWSGTVGASYRYVGDREGDFSRNPAVPRYQLPAYDVIDLRVGVRRDRATLQLYVKNVGDTRGQVTPFNAGALQEVAIIQPRTFGVSLSTEF